MIASANEQCPRGGLLLEMALEAKVRVSRQQHPRIHGAVCRVARRAAFAHGFMFEHERPALGRVAFSTCLLFRSQRRAARGNRGSFVRVMTIAATHFAFGNRMMRGEMKTGLGGQVALVTGLGGFVRIDDGTASTARFRMRASGTVTGLTPNVRCIVATGLQTRVRGGLEITHGLCVALGAVFVPNKFGAGDRWRRQNRARGRHARDDATACQGND